MSSYLDHAATTAVRPSVLEVVSAELLRVGNASSLHADGRRARRVVEEARESVAADLDCRPSDVVFTSGGTEADNLAVKGLYWSRIAADPRRNRVIASAVEHHAVLDPVVWLAEHEGAKVEWIGVDAHGSLDTEAFEAAIRSDPESVALATVMAANNEVGAIQPVRELAEACREFEIPFHVDAVQAVSHHGLSYAELDATSLAVSGHKLGGMVGALVIDGAQPLVPLTHGGGQERNVRSGTFDVASIAGFAEALRVTVATRDEERARVSALRDGLVDAVLAAVPDAVLNGPDSASGARLAGNAHFSFPGCEGDALLMLLDAKGVSCSTGSACTAGIPQPSHVLLAMGSEPALARGSLRFTLGWTSTQADVDALVAALPGAVERARRAGMLGGLADDPARVNAAARAAAAAPGGRAT